MRSEGVHLFSKENIFPLKRVVIHNHKTRNIVVHII